MPTVRTVKAALGLAAALAAITPVVGAQAQTTGAQLFAQNCAACHQPQGQGVPGAFPALAGDPIVNGDGKAMATLVLHGRGGMPNFSDELNDKDLSAILSFVRTSWGNHGGPVDAATVASARGKGSGVPDDGSSVLSSH